MKLFNYLTT